MRRANPVWNCLLALASLVVGVALSEAALRLFHPRYGHLADPPARDAESAYMLRHPDTGVPHAVIHNNLGSRQHRNFSERDLVEGFNIAFFGDSFTENLGLPAPYSFTEPLDYLLNAHPAAAALTAGAAAPSASAASSPPPPSPSPSPSSTPRVNVLNFGFYGSGPGRQYAVYRGLPFKRRLRHVFYVHYENDVRDMHRFGEWGLDARGELVARARPGPGARRGFGRLHLTYLALDVWQRLHGAADEAAASRPDTWPVFVALLERWRSEARANGSVFHVVLPPKRPQKSRAAHDQWRASLATWNVVDLQTCFAAEIDGYRYRDWRFASDYHWNAAGNMVAAHCLYRRLEPLLDLPQRTARALAHARAAYYQAFQADPHWHGERYVPRPPWVVPHALPNHQLQGTVDRYLAIGDDAARRADAARRSDYEAMAATTPAARSNWNVHRRADREIAYLKADCDMGDALGIFFLRVRPAHADRFVTIPIGFADGGPHPTMVDGKCLMTAPLPAWPIQTIWTGGDRKAQGAPWSVKFQWDLARLRDAEQAVAARLPEAAGAFAVHHTDRLLTYLREPCEPADVAPRFFLHLNHLGSDGRAQRRENLDFDFSEQGALFDGRCVAIKRLPGGGPGRVHTGQFDRAGGTIWNAEFTVE